MLVSFVYFGFHTQTSLLLKILMGIVVPLVIIFFWGWYMAPKSNHRLSHNPRLFIALLLFSLSAFVLYQSGQHLLGIIFGILIIFNISVGFIQENTKK